MVKTELWLFRVTENSLVFPRSLKVEFLTVFLGKFINFWEIFLSHMVFVGRVVFDRVWVFHVKKDIFKSFCASAFGV